MNCVLIQSPASATGTELRQILLEALGGTQDPVTLEWGDSTTVVIPQAGRAPGTTTGAGKQICQLLYAGTQAQLESDLQNATLQQHIVVGFQSFDGSVVTTAIENGTLAYLEKQYEDEAQTIEKTPNVNWFPIYQGQAPWTAA